MSGSAAVILERRNSAPRRRAAIGVAAVPGVPLRLLMRANRRADSLNVPVFSLLHSILPPVCIAETGCRLGLGDVAKIFLICVSSFRRPGINTHAGVRNIDTTLVEASQVRATGRNVPGGARQHRPLGSTTRSSSPSSGSHIQGDSI